MAGGGAAKTIWYSMDVIVKDCRCSFRCSRASPRPTTFARPAVGPSEVRLLNEAEFLRGENSGLFTVQKVPTNAMSQEGKSVNPN